MSKIKLKTMWKQFSAGSDIGVEIILEVNHFFTVPSMENFQINKRVVCVEKAVLLMLVSLSHCKIDVAQHVTLNYSKRKRGEVLSYFCV